MKQLDEFLVRIDALTPRERVILFALLLAGLWALVDATLLGPLDKARRGEREQMQAASVRIAAAQEAMTRRAGAIDPARAAHQRLDAARSALAQRMQATQLAQNRLLPAKDMTRVLEGLLKNQPGLRLVAMSTLAAEPLGLPPGAKPEEAALFRQGARITLAGDYNALVRYMENLERLPVGFYWSRAELDASHHLALELTLTLYTLSTERTWLTM
jgi:MSHA biogenesis protein MshJ